MDLILEADPNTMPFFRLESDHSTTVSYFTGRIIIKLFYKVGDCPVFVSEKFARGETIKIAIQMRMSQVIVKNDFQMVINSILGRSQAPK